MSVGAGPSTSTTPVGLLPAGDPILAQTPERTYSLSQANLQMDNGRKPAWLRPFVAARRRLSMLRNQLDKLGVTGSSPVPPIARKPC